MPKHAKLSPSASGRWMHCAGSIDVNARAAQRTNAYAEEGITAHHLLEICMRLGSEPAAHIDAVMPNGLSVTEDMAEAVGLALDWIRSYEARVPKAKVFLECETEPAAVLGCEKEYTSGTSDVVIDNHPVELIVIDYKHGAGVSVDVENNTQLMLYMLGYWAKNHIQRAYRGYRNVIIQPRSRHEDGPVREEVYKHADLITFGKRVKHRIVEIKRDPDARKAGDWCRWCAGAGRCRTLAEYSTHVAQIEFTPIPSDRRKEKC